MFSFFSSYTLPSTSPSIWLAGTPSIAVFEKKKSIIFSNKSLCSTRKSGEGVCQKDSPHTTVPGNYPQDPEWDWEGVGRIGHFNTLSFGPEILKHYHEDTSSGEISWEIKKYYIHTAWIFYSKNVFSKSLSFKKRYNLSYHYYSLIIETINKLGIKYSECWGHRPVWNFSSSAH